MIHTRPAKPADALGLQLRPDALAEFRRLAIPDPTVPMRALIAATGADAVTFLDNDGNTLAIAGAVADAEGRRLYPWLMSSALIGKHSKALLRIAQHFVGALREHRGDRLVCGYIGKASAQSRAFVERLGFHVTSSKSGESDFFHLPINV